MASFVVAFTPALMRKSNRLCLSNLCGLSTLRFVFAAPLALVSLEHHDPGSTQSGHTIAQPVRLLSPGDRGVVSRCL